MIAGLGILVDWLFGIIQYVKSSKKRIKIEIEELPECKDFTILIPVRNLLKNGRQEMLRKMLENLRTFKEQILIVDDGSVDQTFEWLEELGVKVMKNGKGGTKVGAVEKGLKEIESRWIVLIDDDTYLQNPELLPKAIAWLEKNNFDACAIRILPDFSKSFLTSLQKIEYELAMYFRNSLQRKVSCVSGAFGIFKKEVLKEVTEEQMKNPAWEGEDFERTCRLNLKGRKIAYLEDLTAFTLVPKNLLSLIKQRIYWGHGYIRCHLKFRRLCLRKDALGALFLYNIIVNILLHPFKLIALPIVFMIPWLLLIFYLAYLALTVFIYRKASGKLNKILIFYPFYSLFLLVIPTTIGYLKAIVQYLGRGQKSVPLFYFPRPSFFSSKREILYKQQLLRQVRLRLSLSLKI